MVTQLEGPEGLSWISLTEPTPKELANSVRDAGLTVADAEFVAQNYHRPSVTVADDYLILLTTVPVFDKQMRVTTGVPLYFIVAKDTMWSISYEALPGLEKVLEEFEKDGDLREEYYSQGGMGLALYILGELYQGAFRKVNRLSKHIEIAEDAVFQGNERKMVEEVSVLMRDVMDFRKVIRPQVATFSKIPKHELVDEGDLLRWDRLHDQMQQLWELLESLFESTRQLSDVNDSLLQHKENELLRLLTIYSIIAIPMIILVDPLFVPRASGGKLVDMAAFGVIMLGLVGALIYFFVRIKRKRLL